MNEELLKHLQNTKLPRFIAIEGPIGVGKTLLAKRMAELLSCQTLLENTEHNPFLQKFYENPKQNALATQLFFLFQRAQQLKESRQADLFDAPYISDFLIDKDKLFAEQILSPEELRLYQMVHDQLEIEAPKPELVIYLQAPVHTLLQRVQQRGVRSEQHIHADYLARINEAYSRFFLFYDDAPLLIINAEQIDLVSDDRSLENLVSYMLTIKNGRHYFNPSFFSETLT